MHDWQSLSHVRWECKYHVVWIPKYRRKSLYGQLRQYLGQIFKDLARSRESEVLEGHMIDYATNTLYTKGFYALTPPGVVHGPFGTELGCTLFETVWYDKDWYLAK